MYDQYNQYNQYNQSNQPKKPNPLLAGFLIAQLIFIILLIFALPRLFESNEITFDQPRLPSASIDNLNSYLDLDDEDKKDVEDALYELILDNSTNQTITNSEAQAVIVEDTASSLHFDRLGGISYFSAVIDVPGVEQSYDFYYAYPDDPKSGEFQGFFNILCPDRPEAEIYPDFKCENTADDSWLQYPATHLGIASSFLPYYYFDYFSISIQPSEPTKAIISPVSYNTSEETRAAYVDEAKQAMKTLGFSPDLFTYYVFTEADVDYTMNE